MQREDENKFKAERKKSGGLPSQRDLEKELSEYLSKKYGGRVKIISPFVMPESASRGSKEKETSTEIENRINFDLKPEELEDYLNQFIIKQDEAKAILATKICTHFHRIKYTLKHNLNNSSNSIGRIKNNIIMIGPTGVGKTYMVKLIAHKLGVPFVKGDATKFSETGYVGGDVEDLVRDLVYEAGDDIERAQYGIIYIDEIDKIAASGNLIGPDVSRTGVQRALLKPMEETEVDLRVPHDPVSQLQAIERYRRTGKREKRTINTRNILFIMSGAFSGLDEIVRRRIEKQGIGFGADLTSKEKMKNYLQEVKAEDLIAYGFESEFIGRLPVIAIFEELTEEDLYKILKNPNNPIITSKKRDFKAYNIDIKFTDEALRLIAKKAAQERTGARGLVSAVEKVLIPFERTLPSTNIREFLVTEEVAENPKEELELILKEPKNPERKRRYAEVAREERKEIKASIKEREKEFIGKFNLSLTNSRLDLVIDQYFEAGIDIEAALERVSRLYYEVKTFEVEFFEEHGISLKFSEAAVDEVIKKSLSERMSALAFCRRFFKDFEYGLKLVRDRTGNQKFIITKEAIKDPEGYLNQLIKSYYTGNFPNQKKD